MEDRIPRWLQHHHEMCCEKGGYHGRRACMVQRWFHCGDVVSGQMDLYMTSRVKENSIHFSNSIGVKRINSLISILLSKLLQLKAIKITQNLIVKKSVTLMNYGVLEFS